MSFSRPMVGLTVLARFRSSPCCSRLVSAPSLRLRQVARSSVSPVPSQMVCPTATSPWSSLPQSFGAKALAVRLSRKQRPTHHRSRGCSALVASEHQSFSLGSAFIPPRLPWNVPVSSLPPNPSLHPTCYGWLRQPSPAGELKR